MNKIINKSKIEQTSKHSLIMLTLLLVLVNTAIGSVKDPNHLYYDDEISQILMYELDDGTKVNIVPYLRIAGDAAETQVNITEEVRKILKNPEVAEPYIIPVNLNDSHWTAMYTMFNKKDNVTDILYIDPLGCQAAGSPNLALLFESLLIVADQSCTGNQMLRQKGKASASKDTQGTGSDPKYVQYLIGELKKHRVNVRILHTTQQKDGTSCGAFTTEYLITLAKSNNIVDRKDEEIIRILRKSIGDIGVIRNKHDQCLQQHEESEVDRLITLYGAKLTQNNPLKITSAMRTKELSLSNLDIITSMVNKRLEQLTIINNISEGNCENATHGIWLTPFVGAGTQKSSNNLQAYKHNFKGLTIGYDQSINDSTIIGLAGSLNSINVKGKENLVTYTGTLYGAKSLTPQINIMINLAYGKILTNSNGTMKTEGDIFSGYLNPSYNITLSNQLFLIPKIALACRYLSLTPHQQFNKESKHYYGELLIIPEVSLTRNVKLRNMNIMLEMHCSLQQAIIQSKNSDFIPIIKDNDDIVSLVDAKEKVNKTSCKIGGSILLYKNKQIGASVGYDYLLQPETHIFFAKVGINF